MQFSTIYCTIVAVGGVSLVQISADRGAALFMTDKMANRFLQELRKRTQVHMAREDEWVFQTEHKEFVRNEPTNQAMYETATLNTQTISFCFSTVASTPQLPLLIRLLLLFRPLLSRFLDHRTLFRTWL